MVSRRSVTGIVAAAAATAGAQVASLGGVAAASAPARLAVAGHGADRTPDAPSASALVASAAAAARVRGSVHYVEQASAGDQTVSVVGDVSPSRGQQTIEIHNGATVGHIRGVHAAGNIYFRGDADGLRSYLDMPAALATRFVDRWIRFSPSDAGFARTARQFTLYGPLSEIALTGRLTTSGTAEVDGVRTHVIRGRTTALSSDGKEGNATLYVALRERGLPVRFTGTGTQDAGTVAGEVDFSHWGERVRVQAPADSISAAKVH